MLSALLVFAMILTLLPATQLPVFAANQKATYENISNGYRTVFSDVEVGQAPDGWSGGDWSIITGAGIDNWGVDWPTNDWNHFLKYDGGSPFFVYDKVYADFNYTTHANMTVTGGVAGVVFRYADGNNYYYYKLDSAANKAYVGKVVGGTDTVLAEADYSFQENKWYNLQVIGDGSSITCKINTDPYYIEPDNPGQVLFTVTDDSLTEGKCGYWATDDTQQYTNFAVSNTGTDITIENEYFTLTTGAYGQIKSLKMKGEAHDYDFVGNEETHRFEVGFNKWLGELLFTYQVGDGTQETASTGASEDNRVISVDGNTITVTYTAASQLEGGISDFQVTETYSLVDDHVQMDITVKNTSGENLLIQDLGMPITWNNHWQFKSPYEDYLAAAANYVSYEGSYVMLEQGKGGGNKLVFTPVADTDAKFEYRKFRSEEATFFNPPEVYYIYSDAIKSEGQGYLDSTSLTMGADEEKTFSFRFHKIGDQYSELGDVLYNENSLDVTVNPGMIQPKNVTTKIDIYTKETINSVTAKQDTGAEITYVGETSPDHHQYTIQFAKEGRNDIVINYGDDKQSVLQFWIQGDLEQALQSRVDYLMNTLRITDPSDPHCYSFKEVNNITQTPQLGGNGCNNNDYEQMYDGPAFIAEKNVYYPVQEEITAIDDYLTKLVWEKEVIHDGGQYHGYLCHACCSGRCWSDPNPPTEPYLCTRSFNYPRIYNTFWSMYKIADNYPDMTFYWEKEQYLEAAGIIAKIGIKLSGGMGVMGEQTVQDIVNALYEEGFTTLADEIMEVSASKATAISNNPYPFGSEFGTDSTAEEGAYFFSKMFGNTEDMEKTVDKAIAWKGKSNVWYWQATGNRQDNDWWLFQYTVGLHGALLNDWYFNNVDNPEDYWAMVYPFKYAPFVHIKTSDLQECPGAIGTVWWNYRSTDPYNWNLGFPYAESGEADISLWAGLQIASADVVLNDPSFGTTGYGCLVTDNGATLNVVPQDGLFRRLNVVGAGFQVELHTDRYTQADITNGETVTNMTLALENATGTAHSGELTIRGMPAGTYKLYVDGSLQAYVNIADSDEETTVAYQINSETAHTLSLEPAGEIGSLKVAVVGDETLLGEGTSDWEENGIKAHLEAAFGSVSGYEVQFFTADGATVSGLKDGQLDAITQYAPNMVVLLAGSNDEAATLSADYQALVDSLQNISDESIVYAVTLPVATESGAALNDAILDAAGKEQAVTIDLQAMMEEAPQNVQANGLLDNNGAAQAANLIFNTLTARSYTAAQTTHKPYEGIQAEDYDAQSGAQYEDSKTTSQSEKEPYVTLSSDGYLSFQDVNFDKETNKVTLTVKSEGESALSIYKDAVDGTRIGYLTVNTNGQWEQMDVELPAIMGTCDLYLVAEGAVSVKDMVFFENLFPEYSTDFSDDAANETEWVKFGDWGNFTFGNGVASATGGAKVYVNNKIFADLIYEADVTVTDEAHAGQYAGLIFRGSEPAGAINNQVAYALTITPFSDQVKLQRFNGASTGPSGLGQWTYTLEEGVTYRLKVVAKGSTISVYIDNNLIATVTDENDPYLSGSIGLISCDGASTFDNVFAQGIADGAVINTQPEDVSVNEGETATFTVEAEPSQEGATLTYQWQISTDRAKWEDIPGATNATYTTDALAVADSGKYYRCVVTENRTAGGSVSVNSEAAQVTVNGIPVVTQVTVTPESATVGQGNYQQFTAQVTGQYDPDTSVTWTVSGNTSAATVIDANGRLFVAVDEEAETLTITATSNHDASVSGSAQVTVKQVEPATEEDIALHLEFDSTEGNQVKDYSVNDYNATIAGTINANSWSDKGFAFVGDNSLKLTGADLVNPNMTIVYEVTRTAAFDGSYSFFWGMNQSEWNTNGIWVNSSGDIPVFVATDGFTSFQTEGWTRDDFFPLNETVQVAITVNSETGEYAIYRNGVPCQTNQVEGIHITVPSNPYNTIGMAGYDNEFLKNFSMSKYMIFHKDLSAADVERVYQGEFDPDTQEPEFVPVTDITGVPVSAEEGTALTLTGTVTPDNATNQTIVWAVKDAGTTGAVLEGNVLTTTAAGTVTVTATVENGLGEGENFVKEFTITITESTPEHTHTLTAYAAKEPTCTEAGNIAYWYCTECGKYFSDEAATQEITQADTVVAAKGHEALKTEAKEPTCTENGNIEYWHCTVCDKYFSDEACTEVITQAQTVIPAQGHKAVKIEAKEATCTEDGNIEYWHCTACDKYFSDANCSTEITLADTVVEAKGHNFVDGVCTDCGEKDPDYTEPTDPSEPTKPTDPSEPTDPTNPSEPTEPGETTNPTEKPTETTKPATDPEGPDQTGETTNLALLVCLLLSSAACMAVVIEKSRKVRRG